MLVDLVEGFSDLNTGCYGEWLWFMLMLAVMGNGCGLCSCWLLWGMVVVYAHAGCYGECCGLCSCWLLWGMLWFTLMLAVMGNVVVYAHAGCYGEWLWFMLMLAVMDVMDNKLGMVVVYARSV